MKKIIIAALCLIFLSLPILAKPAPRRITFRRGATKAVVTGQLYSYRGSVDYVIRLRAGQRLRITSDQAITIAELANPSGEDVMDRAANCNAEADISPTVAGDYKISIVECSKTDPWKGTFKLFISVK